METTEGTGDEDTEQHVTNRYHADKVIVAMMAMIMAMMKVMVAVVMML